MRIELKDLYLGKLDAKNELLDNTEEEKVFFVDSFLIPSNLLIEDYLNGLKYYVSGLKGTGKTALLRYVAIKAEEEGHYSSFVLFKSNFSEQDRKDFQNVVRSTTIAEKNSSALENEDDFEEIWRWFLHRHIVKYILKNKLDLFEKNKDWEKYVACVSAPKTDEVESGIFRLFPKLKRGSVEINVGIEALNTKLGLEFDWEDSSKSRVKFSSLVKQADTLFENLTGTGRRFFVLIDELELSLGSTEQYSRDIRLIRDLILAIEKLNRISRQRRLGITLIGAIRTEVVTAVKSAGKEINKLVFDFGTRIVWHQSGDDINKHPILQILIRRIAASEKKNKVTLGHSSSAIWSRYFPIRINGRDTPRYLLHQTWYRPRDIIRLLVLAKGAYPESIAFSQQVFDGTRLQYSTDCWSELVEELTAKYSNDHIEAIRRIFTGIPTNFDYKYLLERVSEIREIYSDVDDLLTKYKLDIIVTDAYKIGIIGNMDKKARFSFRGQDDILLEKKMMVHYALWPILSIESGTGVGGEMKDEVNSQIEDIDNKLFGKVKWFNDQKGYGFIENTQGQDLFVHFSEINSNGYKTLEEGKNVRYSIKQNERGYYAVNVQKLD